MRLSRAASSSLTGGLVLLSAVVSADPLFDLDAIMKDPVDAAVLSTEVTNGLVFQSIEYTTRLTNGAPERIQGLFVFPEGGKKLPAVFWSNGGMAPATRMFPGLLASNGYAALSITLPHKLRNSYRIPFDTAHPELANLTLLARDQLRGITVLSQRPEVDPDRIAVAGASYGGVFATLIAGVDPRVKAGFSFFGAGNHMQGSSLPQFLKMGTTGDVEVWNRTIDGAFRLKDKALPFMWSLPVNDHWFHFPAVVKTVAEAAGADKRLVIAPYWQHGFTPEVDATLFRFLDTTPVAAHPRPAFNAPGPVQLEVKEGKVVASFGWTGDHPAVKAEVVASYGAYTPWLGWPHRASFVFPARLDGKSAAAVLPIPSRQLPLVVWGTLTDADGTLVSSLPRVIEAADLAAFPVESNLVLNCFVDSDLGETAHFFYRSMNETLPGSPDAQVKHQGTQSIRIDPPTGTNAQAGLTLKLFHSVPGLAHRFGVFLRAEKTKTVLVRLTPERPAQWQSPLARQLAARDPALAPLVERWAEVPAPITVTNEIGPEWREVVLEVPVPQTAVDGYSLEIKPEGKADGAYWIDTITMRPVWPK